MGEEFFEFCWPEALPDESSWKEWWSGCGGSSLMKSALFFTLWLWGSWELCQCLGDFSCFSTLEMFYQDAEWIVRVRVRVHHLPFHNSALCPKAAYEVTLWQCSLNFLMFILQTWHPHSSCMCEQEPSSVTCATWGDLSFKSEASSHRILKS